MSSLIVDHYAQVHQLSAYDDSPSVQAAGTTETTQAIASLEETFQIVPIMLIGMALIIAVGLWMQVRIRSRWVGGLVVVLGLAMSSLYVSRMVGETHETRVMADPSLVPQAVLVGDVTASGFEVAWSTRVPVTGLVQVWLASEGRDSARVYVEEEATARHYLAIDELEAGERYMFVILSGSQWYGEDGQPLVVELGE